MRRWIIVIGFVVFCLFTGSLAKPGKITVCPDIKPLEGFRLGKIAGRWYVVKMFSATRHDPVRCETYDFVVDGNGNATGTHGQWLSRIRKPIVTEFPITTPNKDEPGRLKARIWGGDKDYDALVVNTDYESYIVLHLCVQYKFGTTERTWVLTKNNRPPESVLTATRRALKGLHYNKTHRMMVKHKNCPYPPLNAEASGQEFLNNIQTRWG